MNKRIVVGVTVFLIVCFLLLLVKPDMRSQPVKDKQRVNEIVRQQAILAKDIKNPKTQEEFDSLSREWRMLVDRNENWNSECPGWDERERDHTP